MTVSTIYPDKTTVEVNCTPNEKGEYVVRWRTATMPAPAFAYFKDLASAKIFRRGFEAAHQ